jgi:hypothetical protein
VYTLRNQAILVRLAALHFRADSGTGEPVALSRDSEDKAEDEVVMGALEGEGSMRKVE